MKENKINNTPITLDMELLAYLSEPTAMCNRLFAFYYLLQQAVKEPTVINKRGIDIHLNTGQLEASILTLSNKWKWHRKTVIHFLDELEKRGYLQRMSNKLSTIIEMTCLNRCTSETEISCPTETTGRCATESVGPYITDFRKLPSVVHQDPPMQLTDEIHRKCRSVYDLFIETFPLLDKPSPYNADIEKDIYYVFWLGMRGNFDLLKKYFSIISADPLKNGTMADKSGISPYKESFKHLFSSNWQLVLDCDAEYNRNL